MNNWDILGILPTDDQDEIRKAYIVQLGQHHPEDDPEGFAKLRNAYETILRELEEKNKPDETEIDDSPTALWIRRVAECYEDYQTRISEEAWKELLQDDVCFQLDETEVASQKLLIYLMEHYWLPNKIWKMFDETFHWEENHKELYSMFPESFIHYVRNSIGREERFEYHLIEVGLGVEWEEVDKWIRQFLTLDDYYNLEDMENVKIALEEIKKSDIYYPRVELIEIAYLAYIGETEEAIARGKRFMQVNEDYMKEYTFAHYVMGGILLNAGQAEEGLTLLKECVERKPEHYYACLELLKYYIKHPEKIIEAEPYIDLLKEKYSGDEVSQKYREEAYKLLIPYYEKEVLLEDEETKYRLASYYYGASEEERCGKLCRELLTQNGAYGKVYYLLASMEVKKENFEKAIEYNSKWIEVATEEEKKQAYEKRGMLYVELERYEEAVADYDSALSYDCEDISDYIKKCYSLNKLQKYEEIIDIVNQLIDKGHTDIGVIYYWLAQAGYKLGNYTEAMEASRECLRLNAHITESYQIQVKIYFEVGQYEDAMSVIEMAKSYELGEDEELIYYEVEILRKTNELEKAEALCRKAIERYKENDKLYYSYALIKQDPAEANELLDESIRLKPRAFKFYLRGNLYWDMRQYGKSIDAFKEALEYGEHDNMPPAFFADTLDNIGRLHNICGAYKEAEACFKKAIAYNSNHRRVYTDLAGCYEKCKDYEQAIEAYTKQIEVEEEAYDYVGRGWCYIELKQYNDARADFEAALKVSPEDAYAMNGMGEVCRRQGEDNEAEGYYRKAIQFEKKFYNAYRNLITLLIRLERLEEAMEIYKVAIEEFPDDKHLHIKKGNLHFDLKQYTEALKEYDLAEVINDKNFDFYYNKALIYQQLKAFDKALVYYEKALKMREDDIDTLQHMANIYKALGKDELFFKYHKKVLKIDPNNEGSRYNIGRYYIDANQVAKGLELYKECLEINPDNDRTMYYIGECYLHLKQYDEAIKWLTKAIEHNSKNGDAYIRLGRCYAELCQKEKAISYLKEALKLQENSCWALGELSFAYYNMGEFKEAEKGFTKILELNDRHIDGYQGLGLIYSQQKQYEKAYEYMSQAVKVSKLSYTMCMQLNEIVFQNLHNYEEALAFYKDVFKENNEPPRMAVHIGQLLKVMGNQKKANGYFKMALEAFKSDIEQHKANACTYFRMGECYRGLGNKKKAKTYYTYAILKAGPCKKCDRTNCYEAHFALGEMYEEDGNDQAALEHYERADALDQTNEYYKEAIRRIREKGTLEEKKGGLKKLFAMLPFLNK